MGTGVPTKAGVGFHSERDLGSSVLMESGDEVHVPVPAYRVLV